MSNSAWEGRPPERIQRAATIPAPTKTTVSVSPDVEDSTPVNRYRARLGLPPLPPRPHDGDVHYWSAVAMGWQDVLDAYDEHEADLAVLVWLRGEAA